MSQFSHDLQVYMLARVFNIDVETCCKCGGRMKISAALEDPKVIRKIQEHIGLDAKTVQLKPARGPKNNLLPTSEAESAKQLKIAELFAATKDDGKLRDSFPGYSHSNE